MKRTSLNVLLLALAFLSEGCWFRRGPKASPPPPPTQATKQAPAGPAAPTKKDPVVRTPSGARKTAPPALKPQPDETAPAREPVLGQLMTDEQKAEYRRAYDMNASAANRILSSFSVRKLAGEQIETLARIRSFLQQAAEARETDWSLAANLARRAAVLASELAGRVE